MGKRFSFVYTLLCIFICLHSIDAAAATNYGIKVGGVPVTSDNCNNITGDNIKQNKSSYSSYSAVYDPSTKTLTLDNIKIVRTGSDNRAILNESCDGLTIVIKHDCYLSAEDSSPVRLNKNTTIRSTLENDLYQGVLSIHGVYEDGLTVGNGATLTFDGAFVYSQAERSSALEGATGNEKVIIKNHSVVGLDYWQSNLTAGSISIKDIASLDIQASHVYIPYGSAGSTTYSDCKPISRYSYAPCVPIDETTFPDEKLREYILSTKYKVSVGLLIHTPNITEAHQTIYYINFPYDRTIESVTSIDVSNKGIANAKGLEMFVNLTSLNVADNNLTSLTVTPYKSLEKLYCQNNQLSYLNPTNNRKLTELNCSDNQLTALNLLNNTELTVLQCGGNQLAELNLSNNKELTELLCNNNQLTTLNLANHTKLTGLDCRANQLPSLTLACNETLEYLICIHNKLTSLSLSEYKKLATLNCATNRLTSLTLPKGNALLEVFCSNNKLTALDASGNTELTNLQCVENSLTSLNVKNCGKLDRLFCGTNKLSELDLTDNTAMTWLDCSNNVLTTLNVSKNRDLKKINASYNKLETLDLTWNNKTDGGVIIFGNKIKGEGLDNLIAKLPAVEGRKLYFVDHRYENEDNACTAAQVEAAQNKGWTIYHQWGNQEIPTTECKNYDLWIEGLRACNHGTGFARIKYDNTTTTLTLDNASIDYDGVIAILSKIDNLNVILKGKSVINTSGYSTSSLGMYLMTNTDDSKVTFSGGGEFSITSGGIGILTLADLEFKDGVKVSAECTDVFNGMQGRKFSADGNLPSIIMSGEGTEVKAKGGKQGSVLNFHALNFSDGIAIAEPTGATFAEDYGVIKNNTIVAGEWVVFKKAGTSYDLNNDGKVSTADIQVIINEMKKPAASQNMSYDLNNDGKISTADIQVIINEMKK